MRAALALIVALAACRGPAVIWSGHTPDRRRTIEVIEDDGRQYVVVDGERRAAYRAIAGWSIEVSDDGHVAFAARLGAQWVVVHDGRHGEAWDAIGELRLAPGNRLTYLAERAGRWHVVTGGVVGPAHDAILAGSLTSSPDGRRIAYAATEQTDAAPAASRVHDRGTAPAATAAQRVFVDGKPGPRFDGVGELAFTADGSHVVHVARLGRAAHVVVDHVAGPAWGAVDHLTLSPVGNRIAYAALDGDDWRVMVQPAATATGAATATAPHAATATTAANGAAIMGPAADAVRRIAFSPDGAQVAWLAVVEDHMVIAIDERPIAAGPGLDAFGFGPGGRFAYVAPVGAGERVVVDGVEGAPYDEVGAPVFAADGRVAYSARRGERWCVVVDGQERAGGSWVGDPVFSPDGTRLAYLAQRGRRWFAVVDGKAHPHDLLMDGTLTFSRDSRHWAVVAGDLETETLYFAVDGTRHVPLRSIELYSAATRGGQTPFDADPEAADVLRRWSQAEADRAR